MVGCDDDFETLNELHAKTTSGVWSYRDRLDDGSPCSDVIYTQEDDWGIVTGYHLTPYDGAFIVAAHERVPKLIAALKRARHEKEDMRQRNQFLRTRSSDLTVAHLRLRNERFAVLDRLDAAEAEVEKLRPLQFAVGKCTQSEVPEAVWRAWRDSPGYRKDVLTKQEERIDELEGEVSRLKRELQQLKPKVREPEDVPPAGQPLGETEERFRLPQEGPTFQRLRGESRPDLNLEDYVCPVCFQNICVIDDEHILLVAHDDDGRLCRGTGRLPLIYRGGGEYLRCNGELVMTWPYSEGMLKWLASKPAKKGP